MATAETDVLGLRPHRECIRGHADAREPNRLNSGPRTAGNWCGLLDLVGVLTALLWVIVAALVLLDSFRRGFPRVVEFRGQHWRIVRDYGNNFMSARRQIPKGAEIALQKG